MSKSHYSKKHLVTALFAVFSLCVGCAQQNFNFVEMGVMPPEVNESSGLAVASETSFWTHNDRGGKAEIYEIDFRGELVRTVELRGAGSVDYEDMTQDNDGNLYLGDFGNNKKDRLKMTIYKIATAKIKVEAVKGQEPVFYIEPEAIEFILPYEDMNSECHYDIEAMVWHDNKLTMFSKDRCDKVNNYMHIYSVPDSPGNHTANRDGIFNWEDRERVIKITSADLSWDGDKLVLLSKDAVHIFFGYKKDRWFQGSYRYIPMEKSKKEAACHLGDCDLYITEESKKDTPGKIIKLNMCGVEYD